MTKKQMIRRQRLIKQLSVVAVIFLITTIMLMIVSLKSCTNNDFDIADSMSDLESVIDTSDIDSSQDILSTLPSSVSVDSISLNANAITLTVDQKNSPVATVFPENATDKSLTWTSSDVNIATVDANGNIIGVAEGSCIITVYSNDNKNASAEIKVTVTAKAEDDNTELTYIQGILVVNKTYGLPQSYNPGVDAEANNALKTMFAAASNDGINLFVASGFRSYSYQKGLYEKYVARDGQAAADRYSARPGHSEHQTGLAFDLNQVSSAFEGTHEAIWLEKNCYKYGFIIRYPKGKESVTGYNYEPWHIRYLGVQNATAVYNSGLTLEEYLGITSVYQ